MEEKEFAEMLNKLAAALEESWDQDAQIFIPSEDETHMIRLYKTPEGVCMDFLERTLEPH